MAPITIYCVYPKSHQDVSWDSVVTTFAYSFYHSKLISDTMVLAKFHAGGRIQSMLLGSNLLAISRHKMLLEKVLQPSAVTGMLTLPYCIVKIF